MSLKSFFQGFLFILNFPKVVQKLSEYFAENYLSQVLPKAFPEFYGSPNLSNNFETILVHIRFQFSSKAESIGQNGAISQSDCEKAGQNE